MSIFPNILFESACDLIRACRAKDLRLTIAESCTGGLVSAILTDVPGSSDVLERGFVTYSNAAKIELLGVPASLIEQHGAVSANVALAMAEGALLRSHAKIAISITGIAGPGGGTPQKPVGLVYMGIAAQNGEPTAHRFTFPENARDSVRMASVAEALRLIREAI